jgi:hypothetical protein
MLKPAMRSAVAFSAGAILFPVLVIAAYRSIFPVEATGWGNAMFWTSVVVGASIAAVGVWFKPVPVWVAVLSGPMAVLAILAPWIALSTAA